MRIVRPSLALINPPVYPIMAKHVERAGRTCYKSEQRTSPDISSAIELIARLIKMGHHSVLEHSVVSVRFICDRGVSHELVRHRAGISFSQESTRYCTYSRDNFGNSITFISPVFWENSPLMLPIWKKAMSDAEAAYMWLLSQGATAQEARSVLPNSLKTEIVVTANLREWLLVFRQRCSAAAHPSMQQIMLPTLKLFAERFPVFFQDLYDSFSERFDFFSSKHYSLAEVMSDEVDYPMHVIDASVLP